MFPSFVVLGKEIGSYAVCAMVGLLFCGFVAYHMGKRRDISFEQIILIMLVILGGLLVGGHAVYGLTNLGRIIEWFRTTESHSFKQMVAMVVTAFSGMVFYGGFVGGAVALYFYSKSHNTLNVADTEDMYAVAIPLFHAFGRIGCFLGGCCYGVESSWGFVTYTNLQIPSINGVVRFPVQLVEAAYNLLIFAVLWRLYNRGNRRGMLLVFYIFLYAPARFVLEFFRGDAIRGFWWGLSTSQWISILLLAVATVVLVKHRRTRIRQSM